MKAAISYQRSIISRVARASRLRSFCAVLLIATGMLLVEAGVIAQSTNGLSLVASGFSGPSGLTLGPGHRLFVSDSAGGMVYRIRPDGLVTVDVSGFAAPRDVIFDRAGNMYVADSSAGKVYKLDRAGKTTVLADGLASPCCLGFDGHGRLLVVHEDVAAGDGGLYSVAISRIAPDGKQTRVASGFRDLQGLLVDRDGRILIAAEGYSGVTSAVPSGAGLYRIDELGQVMRLLDSGSITPRGLTLSPQGTLFFSGTGVSPVSGSVFLTGTGTFEPFVTGLLSPRGLAADARNLYVADEAAGEVWKVPFSPPTENTESTKQASLTDAATTGIEAAVSAPDAENGRTSARPPKHQDESPWGYTGTPDYSSIPFATEGVPQAPAGVTCIIGRVQRTDDVPLRGVTVRLAKKAIRTNSSGYWILTDVPAGTQLLMFDGRSADTGDIHYPISMLPYLIEAKSANRLPFDTWFPILDTEHTTHIQGHRETVHTTPLIPGLEIHISAGTKITSVDGTLVTEFTTTLVPPDKPMYPMGLVQDLGNHFTIQPGGSVCSKPIKVVYNNPAKFPVGTRVPLWEYDPVEHGGWWSYGIGTVSADGRQILPDREAGFKRFGCGLNSRTVPVVTDNRGGESPEPVDLAAGTFRTTATDLVTPGLMPIVLQRTYRNQNNNSYAFGINMLHSYEYRLYGITTLPPSTNNYIDFTVPSDTSYHFVYQTNSPLVTFFCTNDYRFAGAKIYQIQYHPTSSAPYPSFDGSNYIAVMKDGTKFYYDGKGYLWAIRDTNNNTLQINRVNDQGGKILSIVQPSGRSLSFSYNNSGTLVSSVTDSSGRSVGYVYDASNRLTVVTNALYGVTQYAYDASNNMTSVTLPNTVPFVQNSYDSSNRVTNQIVASGATYSIGYTISTSYVTVVSSTVSGTAVPVIARSNDGLGFKTNSVDALGNTNIIIRGARSEIIKTIDPLGRTNSYVYDANFNVTAITNAQGKVTKFTYEPSFNRLTSVIDPLGRTNSFSYDDLGNLTSITNALGKVTKIAYNQFGLPTSVTDPLTNIYTFTYNDSLDLVIVTDPLGNQVQRSMDSAGRTFALVDQFSRTVRINHDALDRITNILDPINGQTSFQHDLVGNLTNVVDALTNSVNYSYDSMNRLSTRTDPLGQIERYFYDTHGNLTNFVDRRGISMAFKYDGLDRRTGVVFGTESNVRLLYDKVGRVTNVVDSVAGSTKLTYDTLNRLTQVIDINGTITYGYNDVGLRTNMSVAGENSVFYRYDNANRLTNVTQGTFTTSLFYDDLGRRTKLVLPNAINVLYGYDAASRLTNITYLAAVTNKIDYGYDQTGKRVSQASALSNYNLPSAVSTSSYDAANHQLVFGSYNILYDANGNVTNIVSGTTTNKLLWSSRNQLTGVVAAVTGSFAYDGIGRRITRTVSGTTEKYLYDGLDVIQQLDSGGVDRCDYFRGPGLDEPWQRIDIAPAGGNKTTTTNRIYLVDAVGSVVALTDSSGSVSNRYAYEPFGATTNTLGSNKNSYKFAGREDDGTGIYYFRARYYHPGLGRFISEDPIRFRGGNINLYGYVGNDPVNFRDPRGLLGVVVDPGTMEQIIQTAQQAGQSGGPYRPYIEVGVAGTLLVAAALDSDPGYAFDPVTDHVNTPPFRVTFPVPPPLPVPPGQRQSDPKPDYNQPPKCEPEPLADSELPVKCTNPRHVSGLCLYTCTDTSQTVTLPEPDGSCAPEVWKPSGT